MDLLDHLVAEDVVAVEHLDGADGAGAGVAGVLHLGEAALPDGLADLVRAHPRLPPRRRGLRHPSGGGRARTGGRRGRSHEEADRQGAAARWVCLRWRLLGWFDGTRDGRDLALGGLLRSARVRLYKAAALGDAALVGPVPVRSVWGNAWSETDGGAWRSGLGGFACQAQAPRGCVDWVGNGGHGGADWVASCVLIPSARTSG